MSDKIEERIAEKEAEMAKMQYNKATQGHFATLRAQIAQLRNEILEKLAASSGRKGSGFAIRKHGDATVILLGFPSVGKSTLLNSITNKESKVAAYEFTTLTAIPAMMNYDGKYKGARIQILDLPGVIEGGASGKGRGKEVFASVRNADLIAIMLDAKKPEHYEIILDEIYRANIRLDQVPPRVKYKKRSFGGINVAGFRKQISIEEVENIFRSYKINNADVYIYNKNITVDQMIDVVSGNRKYVPSIVIINKIDLLTPKELISLKKRLNRSIVPISAENKVGLEELKEVMVEKIRLMRIYLRKPGGKTDYEEPLIIKKDSTVEDVCLKLHKRFKEDFRFANIWGKSAKFPGQKVGLKHVLLDADVVKIVLTS